MPNLASNKIIDPLYIIDHSTKFEDYTLYETDFVKPGVGCKFYTFQDDDNFYIKYANIELLNNIRVLAFCAMKLIEFNGELGYQIIITKSEIKGVGLMSLIFKFLLFEFDETIYSDITHTIPGSMNFWKKMKLWDNIKMEVIDGINKTTEEYTSQEDHVIWGVDFEELKISRGSALNILHFDLMLLKESINQDLYDYCFKNEKFLENKEHIILRIKSVSNTNTDKNSPLHL